MKEGVSKAREKRPSFVSKIQIGGPESDERTVYSDQEMQELFQRDDLKHVSQLQNSFQGYFNFIAYLTGRVNPSYFTANDDYHELKEAFELLTDSFDSYKSLCASFPSPSVQAYEASIEERLALQQDIAQQCRFISHHFFGKKEFQFYAQQDLKTWLQSSKDLSKKLPVVEAECRKKLKELPTNSSKQEKLKIVTKYKGLKAGLKTLNEQICNNFRLSDEALSSLLRIKGEHNFQQAVDKTFQTYFSDCVSKFHEQVLSRFEKDRADVECINRALLTLDQRAQSQLPDSPELIASAVSLFEAHHRLKCFIDRICSLEIDSSDADEAAYLKRVQEKFSSLKERLLISSFSPGNVFSETSGNSVSFSSEVQSKLLTFSSASYKLFLDDLFSHVHECHGALIDAMGDGSSRDVLYDILNQLVGYDAFLAARDFNKLLIGFFSELKEVNKVLPGSAALPEDSFVTNIEELNASFSPIQSRRNTVLSLYRHNRPENNLDQCQRFKKLQPFTLNTPGRITLAIGAGVALCSAIAGIALLETINTALPVAQLFAANPVVPAVIGLLLLSLAAAVVGVGLTCYENGKRGPGLFQVQGGRQLDTSSSLFDVSEINEDDQDEMNQVVESPK